MPRLGHLERRLEDRGGARAVVVDAGALRDGVEVSADDDGAVGATGRGVGQEVLGVHLASTLICEVQVEREPRGGRPLRAEVERVR